MLPKRSAELAPYDELEPETIRERKAMEAEAQHSTRLTGLLDSVTRLNEELTPRRFGMRRRDVPAVATEVLQRLSALSDSDLLSLDKRVRSWSEYLHWGMGPIFPADSSRAIWRPFAPQLRLRRSPAAASFVNKHAAA